MMRSASRLLSENDCVEGGRKKFAVLEPKRGIKVSQTGRFFEALHEDQDRNYRELQQTTEYMNAKQSRRLATMERKQKLISVG